MPLPADLPVPIVAPTPSDAGVASLYQEIILSHYRAPKHKGVLERALRSVEHRNPLCGDVMTMHLRVEGNRIVDAAFEARACSITQATASMLLDRLIGATVVDARAVISRIEQLIETSAPTSTAEQAALGDLRALQSVARFPARKACVKLVTGALTEAMT